MLKRLGFFLALLMGSGVAGADVLGFVVGGGSWSQDADGTLGTDTVASTTFSEGDSATMLWANLEHPVPMLPNARFATVPVDSTNTSGDKLSMDQTDVTLYYEVLDNWLNLDLGLTGRNLDGSIRKGATTDTFNETIPMIYAKAAFDVPVTGLSVGVELNTIGVFEDVTYYLAYETEVGFGLQLGQRTQQIDLDETSVASSLENSGTYLAGFYHF